ncbi:Arginine--tRNA ligase [Trichinella pseudospiralis]
MRIFDLTVPGERCAYLFELADKKYMSRNPLYRYERRCRTDRRLRISPPRPAACQTTTFLPCPESRSP